MTNDMFHFTKYEGLLATEKELQKHYYEITVVKHKKRSHLSSQHRCHIIYI
jgi:hypothetical protein